ncbi:PREDICTED: uncharacterized protein LOC106805990 [Priapulus caudatus]|uniref:Uncharacterized protein LOC106805990 n=1 Tax=Priapulus caudatus TaxID=37621 RepID=A0ABM1DTL5_PRICU|nr:PREDICTED: uncharacterized protein LOC106805990 [Priapulus caudatus]
MDLWTNFAQKGDPTPGILGYGGVKWPKYAETLLTSTSRAYLRLDELSTTAQHFAARSSEYWHSYLYKLQNITESLPDGPATATTQAPSTETTAETTIYVTIGPVEPSEDSLWPLIWTLVGVGGAFLILAILEGVALILMKAKSKSNSKSVKTGSIDASVYKNEVYHNEIYDM